jgi:hypothetical protein
MDSLALENAKPIYVADLETDPFEHGLLVEAFVCGFYDGKNFVYFWGDNWLQEFCNYISTLSPGIIYFHNGGKFDFFHMMEIFEGKAMIINGRFVKIASIYKHEFRDSYSIMPFALKNYKKTEIDYNKMKRHRREKWKNEIIEYLKDDCVYLYELCSAFAETFAEDGKIPVTIGSAAMRELKKVHDFDNLTEQQDKLIRGTYYIGGRVQCFEQGIIKSNLKVYDVNQMYPFTMSEYKHPIGRPTGKGTKITRDTCFITAEGVNYGAFPVRTKKNGISFLKRDGVFSMSIHEWRVAIRYGLFEPKRIIETIDFENRGTFKKFVNKFSNLRNQAKIDGDVTNALFYKYVCNTPYGKFAQNSENYFDYKIHATGKQVSEKWTPTHVENAALTIWRKPSSRISRYNVATAASITGASRSILLEAISKAERPVYCDTDSIICEGAPGLELDNNKLGAWKFEGEGDTIAIAMKKLYALFSNGECIKQANKGVRISPQEIVRCAQGETITYRRAAPSYKIDGRHVFITRRVRMI